MEDYRTIRGTAVGEYEEKKSRFIAQLSFADSAASWRLSTTSPSASGAAGTSVCWMFPSPSPPVLDPFVGELLRDVGLAIGEVIMGLHPVHYLIF